MFHIFPNVCCTEETAQGIYNPRDTYSFGSIYALNLFDKEYEDYNLTYYVYFRQKTKPQQT